jgi:cytoskeletal protein RodZ
MDPQATKMIPDAPPKVSTFGARLQREREKRKITLEDVSVSTKISLRMLRALEEERFDQLPGGIFNKGFVRAYARHLGIDEEQAVADYLEATGETTPKVPDAIVDIPTANVPEEQPEGPASIPWGAVAIVLLLIALGLSLWSFYARQASRRLQETPAQQPASSNSNSSDSIPANSIPTAAANSTVTAPSTSAPSSQNSPATIANGAPDANGKSRAPNNPNAGTAARNSNTGTETRSGNARTDTRDGNPGAEARDGDAATETRNGSPVAGMESRNDSPIPGAETGNGSAIAGTENGNRSSIAGGMASAGNAVKNLSLVSPDAKPVGNHPLAPAAKPFSLLIEAEENSWVSIVADGRVILEGTLIAPAVKSIRAQKQITVKAGNVGGLIFSINEKRLPAQGAPGEIKNLSFGPEGLEAPRLANPPGPNP